MGLKSGQARSSLRNVSVGDAIPDSVEYQYPVSTFTTSTWSDDVGSADMSVTNLSASTFSNGADSVFGDGTDDYGDANGPQNLITNTNFGLAFTIESPGISDLDTYFWAEDSGGLIGVYSTDASGGTPGNIALNMGDGDGGSLADTGSNTIDDGNSHAVVINKIGDDGTNWEIYIDDMTTNKVVNTGNSNFNSDLASISTNMGFYARNNNGSFDRYSEMHAGVFEFNSATYSESERQDFVSRRPEV